MSRFEVAGSEMREAHMIEDDDMAQNPLLLAWDACCKMYWAADCMNLAVVLDLHFLEGCLFWAIWGRNPRKIHVFMGDSCLKKMKAVGALVLICKTTMHCDTPRNLIRNTEACFGEQRIEKVIRAEILFDLSFHIPSFGKSAVRSEVTETFCIKQTLGYRQLKQKRKINTS